LEFCATRFDMKFRCFFLRRLSVFFSRPPQGPPPSIVQNCVRPSMTGERLLIPHKRARGAESDTFLLTPLFPSCSHNCPRLMRFPPGFFGLYGISSQYVARVCALTFGSVRKLFPLSFFFTLNFVFFCEGDPALQSPPPVGITTGQRRPWHSTSPTNPAAILIMTPSFFFLLGCRPFFSPDEPFFRPS